MRKIGKFNLVEVRILLMSIAAIAALLNAAVSFKFITNIYWKILVFAVLAISILLSLIIDIREKLISREKEAQEIITLALDMALLTIGRGKNDLIRSNIFLHNKGATDKVEIHFHSSNMEKAPDLAIKFDKWQGCVGKAWGYEAGVVAIAEQLTPEKRQDWSLTEEQYALTRELRSIIAWPIKSPQVNEQIIGILSFDSTSDQSEFFTSEEIGSLAADISGFIGKLLIAYNIKRPLK